MPRWQHPLHEAAQRNADQRQGKCENGPFVQLVVLAMTGQGIELLAEFKMPGELDGVFSGYDAKARKQLRVLNEAQAG